MTEINAKIIIQDDIADILNISDVEMDGQIESWIERNLNLDDEISDWMGQYFDIDDYLRDADLSQYIEDSDIESQARNLLESYSPVTSCGTGSAFTEAVGKAVRYFLLADENVEYIVKAVDRYNRRQTKKDLEQEIKETLSDQIRKDIEDELRIKHFEEFSKQITQMYPVAQTNNTVSETNQPQTNYGA